MNGILNVYKESGFTSHDVVAKLRGIVGQKRIGHAGTLDPDATGVLPVCLGRSTRLASRISDGGKEYEAVLLLGTETDTQDISGSVVRTCPVTCGEEDIRQTARRFTGRLEQIPPMYSAKKKDGRRLYSLAREGIVTEREPAVVFIEELTVTSVELPRVGLRVKCSRGTYIRTLCHDIGAALGCGGCMESLVRTRVGRFTAEEAHRLDEIASLAAEGRLDGIVISPDRFFASCPGIAVLPEADALAHNGNVIPASAVRGPAEGAADGTSGEEVRAYDSAGRFLGIYEERDGAYRPVFFMYETDQ